MLIACDVDGVLAALHAEWLRRYNADYADTLTIDRITDWGMHAFVRPECGKHIYDYLDDPGLYEHVGVIDGAVAGVAALRAADHEVFFATSCTAQSMTEKLTWLKRHGFTMEAKFGYPPRDFCIVPTERKALYLKADLIIEDAPSTIRDWVLGTPPRRAIVYDMPYNQDATLGLHSFQWWGWCRRASNWAEIVEHVANWNQ